MDRRCRQYGRRRAERPHPKQRRQRRRPCRSYVIGQEFKRRNAEGSLGHLLAHATLGGLTAAAGGNDPLAGALSSGGAEAAAGYISGLFGQTDGSRLSAEQKETVTAITSLIGTAAGAALGSTPADVAQGSLNAKNAVENNCLTSKQLIEIDKAHHECGDEICKRHITMILQQFCHCVMTKW